MSNQQSWVVHKFGGTSLAQAERFRAVADILENRQYGPQCVVVSALGGVTDDLLQMIDLAAHEQKAGENGFAQDDHNYHDLLDQIRQRHQKMANELLSTDSATRYMQIFDRDQEDIKDIARAAVVTAMVTQHTRGVVSGYGELWSAQLLQAVLTERWTKRRVAWLDARDVLVVSENELGIVVNWEISGQKLAARIADNFNGTLVVTGYIARDEAGHPTTLGRNGSDYSASIFGCLLDASQIHIWTDVDGVMTADPRSVTDVQVIEQLSYNEAMELAYFGAKVLHPQTMAPAVSRNIPIYIRNTFAPENPGTRIGAMSTSDNPVKGITSIDGMAIVNVEGAGMIGVPGTAHRLFGALATAQISVVMISQGSSEHSICFAIKDDVADRAREIVEKTFASDLANGTIARVTVTPGLSILAVVGDSMHGKTGVAAKVFGSLGNAGVNVRVIAQGSSERNISAIIDQVDATRAVRAVHSSFYLSPQTLSIGLIGSGTVGTALLAQMASQIKRLSSQFNLDLRVRGVARSKSMLLNDTRINLPTWVEDFNQLAEPVDLDKFVAHIHAEHMPHAVIVDCTADADVASQYGKWLAAGIHVVTPNKKACSSSYQSYQELQKMRMSGDSRFLYETTVGAGLPIIQTVQDLRETGDSVNRVQGILSGTLAYLFNQFDGTRPFSEIVIIARKNGYTEPDPRDDLSGMDVARKITILGREMGMDLELEQVQVESLVPDELVDVSIDEFLERLPAYDAAMKDRYDAAHQRGHVLRYVAQLSKDGEATVALTELPVDHAFAHISLTDNIVQFETDRYCDNPLIVQGPGAGPDVTAAGVFADLLRLSAYLGAAV